ncbi:synaptotagmin-7 isoform X3 [Hydra vulgaris]|uniref:Synaptotagmin-7 isoform X3 n=1 Tax=Hydra vulgaris TaxID=6087 RepID=A0ABM4CVS3_HYDVU
MNINIVFIVFGIILAVIIIIGIILFLKYIKKCKEIIKQRNYIVPARTGIVGVKLLENPISYRTVKAQQPFIQSEFQTGNNLESARKRGATVLDDYESCDASSPEENRENKLQSYISNDLKNYLKSLSKDLTQKLSDESSSSLVDQNEASRFEGISENIIPIDSKKSKRVKWGNKKRKLISSKMYQVAGRLTFRLEYSEDKKTLMIHILRLMDLASQKPANEVSPFVRAYLLPGKLHMHTTKYQSGKKNLFIDEKMIFPNILEKDMNVYKLKIKVYNHARLVQGEILGEVELPLSSLNLNPSQTYQVDLFLKQKHKESKPLLMVSLNHQLINNKLEVIIHKAKYLPKSSNYIYAIVSLVKVDYFERKDTAPRQYDTIMDFNECFEFNMHTSVNSPLKSYSLVITLVNQNNFERDEIIGHVIFSECFSYSATASHWRTVEKTPHKRIVEWHSLTRPDIA